VASSSPRSTSSAASYETSRALVRRLRPRVDRNYQGRTSNGFRGSTRRAYTQMLEARIIPYFDGRARLRLAEIEPRDVKAFVR
jgi:hypothetical protein